MTVPAPMRWAAWQQGSERMKRRGPPSGQSSQVCVCSTPREPL